MATIKDIARAAGVSQGTVSNVLNGRDNVSSDKTQRVLRAVAETGYAINEKAQILRKGSTKTLAVILPNFSDRPYTDFFSSFKRSAESAGYDVDLYTTNDDVETERKLIPRLRSRITEGIAVFSSLHDGSTPYYDAGFSREDVLFVARKPPFPCSFLGFDLYKAGVQMAEYAAKKGYLHVALLIGPLNQASKRSFHDAFVNTLHSLVPSCEIYVRVTTSSCRYKNAVHLFTHMTPQAIFTENIALAQVVENVRHNFFKKVTAEICTFSPIFTFPEDNFTRYEADYRRMGEIATKRLIQREKNFDEQQFLPMQGFSTWPTASRPANGHALSVVSIASPTMRALKSLVNLYEENSGTKVRLVEMSAANLYHILSAGGEMPYDIIRLDVDWFPWFGPTLFEPLRRIDPHIENQLQGFLGNTIEYYGRLNGELLAFPGTPSMQLLFYRRDLFEDTQIKRLFYERYRSHLNVPKTFEEYNRIARFFTREFNPDSPTLYGTTLVLGDLDLAGTEFLIRYFSHTDTLFSSDGKLLIDSMAGYRAMVEIKDALLCASPHRHPWWTAASQEFARGNVAMTIQFINHVSDLVGPESTISNKLGWACVPGGNSSLGGSVIGISRHCKDKEKALDFLRWLSRDDISTANTLLGGMSARTATYQSSEVNEAYPWMPFVLKHFPRSLSQRSRGFDSVPIELRHLKEILGLAVNEVLSGAMEPADALHYANRLFENNQFQN